MWVRKGIQKPETEGEKLGGGTKGGKRTAKVLRVRINKRPCVD